MTSTKEDYEQKYAWSIFSLSPSNKLLKAIDKSLINLPILNPLQEMHSSGEDTFWTDKQPWCPKSHLLQLYAMLSRNHYYMISYTCTCLQQWLNDVVNVVHNFFLQHWNLDFRRGHFGRTSKAFCFLFTIYTCFAFTLIFCLIS